MTRYRARWVVPIARPPLRDAVVEVGGDAILAVGDDGSGAALVASSGEGAVDLGSVAILPGLVNAHTHLELSWLADRVPSSASMSDWARRLVELRGRTVADRAMADSAGDADAAARRAIESLHGCGVSLVGDVSNTLSAVSLLAESPVAACVFHELIGFSAIDPERDVDAARARIAGLATGHVRLTLAAHAPYSVSPALLAAVAREVPSGEPLGIHLAESAEEVEFLRSGSGPWRTLLEDVGAWNPAWRPPGCGPATYLERMGLLRQGLVATHGVQLDEAELERLATAGAFLVTCPRSNRWTGAGSPDVARLYRAGVRIAVGTDSLASSPDLDVLSEVAELRRLAPSVPASSLLDSATRTGADALGFGHELGTVEPGKRARLLAVDVPDEVTDVEEYLVSRAPLRVRWLHEHEPDRATC